MREVKILIPDIDDNESVDIKVVSKGEEMVAYRLEIFDYPKGATNSTRAEFVKECLQTIDPQFEVLEVGLEGEVKIPVLLRRKRN